MSRFDIARGLVVDFGLTDADALEVWEQSGARMESLSSGETAQQKIDHARRYAKGEYGGGYAASQRVADIHAEHLECIPDAWLPPADEFSAAWWARRELPPREKLIGPLVTACRAMLVAPTGAGKTHFAMAIGASLAAGTSIAGRWWAAPAPKRVLVIDGEMPLTLLRDRINDAAGRAGDTADRFVVLSMADFPDVHPLNEGGTLWVDDMIERFAPDLVILDNASALLNGDPRDTEAWRMVEPWVLRLTNRGIAQLWVFHANDDGSLYGDKRVKYRFDTEICISRAGDTLADGINVTYGKTRERTEANAAEYLTGRAKLQGNRWHFKSAREQVREQVIAAATRYEGQPMCTISEFMRTVRPGRDRSGFYKTPELTKWYDEKTKLVRIADYFASALKSGSNSTAV